MENRIPYTFTFDKEQYDGADNKGQMVFLDRSKDANGIPVLTEDQEKLVEQELKIGGSCHHRC